MKTKVFSLIAMFMFTSVLVFAEETTEKFIVSASEACKEQIEKAAKSVEGVSKAEWNSESQELLVVFDNASADLDKIEAAVAKTGFDTPNHTATDEAYNALPDECKMRERLHPIDTTKAKKVEKKW